MNNTKPVELMTEDELFAELESLPKQFANLVNEDAVRHTAENDPDTYAKIMSAFGVR